MSCSSCNIWEMRQEFSKYQGMGLLKEKEKSIWLKIHDFVHNITVKKNKLQCGKHKLDELLYAFFRRTARCFSQDKVNKTGTKAAKTSAQNHLKT